MTRGFAQERPCGGVPKIDHAIFGSLSDHRIRVEQIGLNQRQGLGVVGDRGIFDLTENGLLGGRRLYQDFIFFPALGGLLEADSSSARPALSLSRLMETCRSFHARALWRCEE
jgi:hypothetical protein